MQKQITFLTMMVLAPSLFCAQQAMQQVKPKENRQQELAYELVSNRTQIVQDFVVEEFALKTFVKYYEQDHSKITDDEKFLSVKKQGFAFAKKMLDWYTRPFKTMLTLSSKLLFLLKEDTKSTLTPFLVTGFGLETAWYLRFVEGIEDEAFLSTIIMHAKAIHIEFFNSLESSSLCDTVQSINEYVWQLDEEEEKSNQDETEQDDPQNL